jgi:hypothetical protein
MLHSMGRLSMASWNLAPLSQALFELVYGDDGVFLRCYHRQCNSTGEVEL